MRKGYSNQVLKKLTDNDPTTCLLLTSYPDVPPIRVKLAVPIWTTENYTFHVIMRHSNIPLPTSDWLRGFRELSSPNPVNGIVQLKICEMYTASSTLTDMTCVCTFPCNILLELSFIFQTEINVCEISLSQMPSS